MKNNDFILFAKKRTGEINGMTCGWVTDGILWNRNVKMVFVRKSRYTYEFLNESEYFFTAKFYSYFCTHLQLFTIFLKSFRPFVTRTPQ